MLLMRLNSRSDHYTVLELGSPSHQWAVIEHLLSNLLEYVTHEHGIKSALKAVKESSASVRELFVTQLCLPPKGYGCPRAAHLI
jgi:transcription elongation factor GreA-like protein